MKATSSLLLDLERQLAAVLELSDLTGPLLEQLRKLLGASDTNLFVFDRAGMPTMCGGTLAQRMQEYPPDLFAEDATIRWNLAEPANRFLSASRGFNWDHYLKSRAYVDFYRPREIGFMSCIRPTGLAFGAPHMFGLMFSTTSISRRLSSEGVQQLSRLEIPFRSAARRIARFRALERKQEILYQLLERQHGSFVLWDADGRLAWVSPQAQARLGGSLAHSDLVHTAALALQQLRRTPSSSRGALLGRPHRLTSASGAPLVAEFSWVTTPDARPWLVAEIESCSGSASALASLSRAETRVLRLLMRGLSNAELAKELCVSNETAKTHVKRILAKLQVNSRAKAARIAHELWGADTLRSSFEDR
jgi:DNA-binding NarL/FixJ family response regulator